MGGKKERVSTNIFDEWNNNNNNPISKYNHKL